MFGVDRQVYYRNLKRRSKRKHNAKLIVSWVEELRMIHPKMGGKKLYFLLKEKLENLKNLPPERMESSSDTSGGVVQESDKFKFVKIKRIKK